MYTCVRTQYIHMQLFTLHQVKRIMTHNVSRVSRTENIRGSTRFSLFFRSSFDECFIYLGFLKSGYLLFVGLYVNNYGVKQFLCFIPKVRFFIEQETHVTKQNCIFLKAYRSEKFYQLMNVCKLQSVSQLIVLKNISHTQSI